MSGSQTYNGGSAYFSTSWTAPTGVTRIKISISDDLSPTPTIYYFNVSPGSIYSIVRREVSHIIYAYVWFFNDNELSSPKNMTIYWSNSINQGGS